MIGAIIVIVVESYITLHPEAGLMINIFRGQGQRAGVTEWQGQPEPVTRPSRNF